MKIVTLIGAPFRAEISWPFVEPSNETQETPWSFHFSTVLKQPDSKAQQEEGQSHSCTYYENSLSSSEGMRLPTFTFEPSCLSSLKEVEAQARAKPKPGGFQGDAQVIGYILAIEYQARSGRKGTVTLIDDVGISVTISFWAEEADMYLSESANHEPRLRKGDVVHLSKVYRGSLKKGGKAQICFRTEKLDDQGTDTAPNDKLFDKFRWELSFAHLSVQTKIVHSLLVTLHRRGLIDIL